MTIKKSLPIVPFIKVLLGHKRYLIPAVVALCLGVILNLYIPQLLRLLILPLEEVQASERAFPIQMMSWIVCSLLLQAVVFFARGRFFSLLGQSVARTFRSTVFSNILDKKIEFFNTHSRIDLIARIFSDVQLISDAVSSKLSMVLRYSLQTAGSIALMFYISLQLSILLILTLPVAILIGYFMSRHLRVLMKKQQSLLAELMQRTEESLEMVRLVKVFRSEAFERERFNSILGRQFQAAHERFTFSAFFSSAINFLLYCSLITVVAFGLYAVSNNSLSVANFTTFLIYSVIAGVSFAFLTSGISDFIQALAGLERLLEIDSDGDRLQTRVQVPTLQLNENLLCSVVLREVSFSYPGDSKTPVLKDITCSFEVGKTYLLTGVSGSGKSTLVQLILGLYDPTTGSIAYKLKNDSEVPFTFLTESFGYVPQDTTLFSDSLYDNVRYGSPQSSEKDAENILEELGLSDLLADLPVGINSFVGPKSIQLSGGQRQRIAIARAIIAKPKILVLDEATASLDLENETRVLEMVKKHAPEAIVLVVSHRPELLKYADILMVLSNGQISYNGMPRISAFPHSVSTS